MNNLYIASGDGFADTLAGAAEAALGEQTVLLNSRINDIFCDIFCDVFDDKNASNGDSEEN